MRLDEEDIATKLDKILAQRQERLGEDQQASWAVQGPPLYLRAARERAARLGYGLDDLLRHDLKRIRESRYPGPDCLEPEEVEVYAETESLPPGRLAHVAACPECTALLSAAVRPPQILEERPEAETRRPVRPPFRWIPAWMPAPQVPALAVAATILAIVGLLWWQTSFHGAYPRQASRIVVLSPASASGRTSWPAVACSEVVTSMLAADRKVDVVPWDVSAQLSLALGGRDLGAVSSGDFRRLRKGLGSRSFVRCSADASGPGRVRLYIQVERGGKLKSASFEARGEPSKEVFDLAFNAGRWVQTELGGEKGLSESKDPYRYALPTDAEAVRLYSQGLAQLTSFRPQEAIELLRQAVRREKHPLVYAALSKAWSQLGDAKREQKTAEVAFQAAGNYSLPEFAELALQGRRSESSGDWQQAIHDYKNLERVSLNPVSAGIHLAEAHLATSDAKSALAKVAELRKAGVSDLDGARLDLVEAQAAEILGDLTRQRQGALRAVQTGRDLAARSLEAEGSVMAGRAIRAQRELAAAGELFSRAQRLFAETGDANGSASVLREQGVSAQMSDQRLEAENLFREALSLYQTLGNRGGVAKLEIDLGHLDADKRRSQDAMTHYARALQIFSDLGNDQGMARALVSKGILFWDAKDFPSAYRYFKDALRIDEKISDRSGAANVLTNLGQLMFEEGRIPEARKVLEQALDIRQETGLRRAEISSHRILAEVLVYEDDLTRAERHYDEALAISRELKISLETMARIRLRRAVILMEQGKLAPAEEEIRALLKDKESNEAETVFAQLLLLQGRAGEARTVFSRLKVPPDSRQQYEVAILSARIDIASGRASNAVSTLQPLLEQVAEEQLALVGLEIRLALAEAHLAMGRAAIAREELETVRREADGMGADLLVRKAAALLQSQGQKATALSSLFPLLFQR